MKKLIFVFLLAGLVASCGTTKIERQAQRTFKGDWTLTNITYPGSSGFVDVTLFDDASRQCFLNSKWHFISNNNSGYYQLFKSDCNPGKRPIQWNVVGNSDSGLFYFTLKRAEKGRDARQAKSGSKLELVTLTQNYMVWEETVSFEGEPFVIKFEFSKIEEN